MSENQTLQEWFLSELDSLKNDPEFLLEQTLLDFTDTISYEMEKQGMTRSELAEKIGKKPPTITRILRGHHNMTFKTAVEIAAALGFKINLNFAPFDDQKDRTDEDFKLNNFPYPIHS